MRKTQEEIDKIKEGGKILNRILLQTAELVKSGVSTWELNTFAEAEIVKAGGRPSFKGYGNKGHLFPAGLCTSVNAVVVHGVPSKEIILKEGDIVGLDIGMEYKGLFTDTAITVPVGKISEKAQNLLSLTKKALLIGIAEAKIGNRVGDIGAAVQKVADDNKLGIIRDLVGHGVGHAVHEEPQVPNYGKKGTGPELTEGLVIAIEPMFTLGTDDIFIEDDGWTVTTRDESLAAHFEHTVVITKNGPEILT
ncbi:MAG: type I methionyl aminopeptidase [Candidatus Doudnabacteria bacterium]